MSSAAHRMIVVILRHENSIDVVKNYIEQEELGECVPIVLDRIQRPDDAPAALARMTELFRDNAEEIGAVIVGTKVYDQVIDHAQDFVPFVNFMHASGLSQSVPVVATHLSEMGAYFDTLAPVDKAVLDGMQEQQAFFYADNDNLGTDGMKNLGTVVKTALAFRR